MNPWRTYQTSAVQNTLHAVLCPGSWRSRWTTYSNLSSPFSALTTWLLGMYPSILRQRTNPMFTQLTQHKRHKNILQCQTGMIRIFLIQRSWIGWITRTFHHVKSCGWMKVFESPPSRVPHIHVVLSSSHRDTPRHTETTPTLVVLLFWMMFRNNHELALLLTFSFFAQFYSLP